MTVRKASSGPNMTVGRTKIAPGYAVRTASSPWPRLRIYGDSGLGVGTDSRDVHELLNPEPARFHSDALSTLDMHCMKGLFAVFDIETDRVYHTARASDRISH